MITTKTTLIRPQLFNARLMKFYYFYRAGFMSFMILVPRFDIICGAHLVLWVLGDWGTINLRRKGGLGKVLIKYVPENWKRSDSELATAVIRPSHL